MGVWRLPEGHRPQQWGAGNGNQWESPTALREAMGPEGRSWSLREGNED